MQGKIEAIWIKRGKLAPMDAVSLAELVKGKGLRHNANQGGWRQVTLLDADVWERVMEELDADLNPVVRRANILVRGLDLVKSRGKILQLGGTANSKSSTKRNPVSGWMRRCRVCKKRSTIIGAVVLLGE